MLNELTIKYDGDDYHATFESTELCKEVTKIFNSEMNLQEKRQAMESLCKSTNYSDHDHNCLNFFTNILYMMIGDASWNTN